MGERMNCVCVEPDGDKRYLGERARLAAEFAGFGRFDESGAWVPDVKPRAVFKRPGRLGAVGSVVLLLAYLRPEVA